MNRLLLLSFCACAASVPTNDTGQHTGDSEQWVRMGPGTFTLGCTTAQEPFCEQSEEGPAHTVTLTRGFFLDKKEVTQTEFETRMATNPSENPNCSNCPVEQVRFQHAMEFANARSQSEARAECYECADSSCLPVEDFLDCEGYRLPTNAEWEYAARCGKDLLFAGSNAHFDVAWTAHSAAGRTHSVGELQPNACGLFDLSGNVWEMVHDWYNPYPSSEQTDPVGPVGGELRILRGGAWNLEPEHARVSNRWDSLEEAGNNVGFRLARSDMASD
jgi:formylglycine-generating enzyme required for sulfatase activity